MDLRRGSYDCALRLSVGSPKAFFSVTDFAILAAIRRASSLLSNLGAAAYLKPYSRAIADMGI